MINNSQLTTHNSSIAVLGLGRVGQTVCRYLLKTGVNVYAYDDNQKRFTQKETESIRMHPNLSRFKITSSHIKRESISLAITSPGLSEKSIIIQLLRKNSIPIIDEIEFTADRLPYSVFRAPCSVTDNGQRTADREPLLTAITGTNGKSTTTALLGRILSADGRNCFWGGNLAPGLPFATSLFQEPKDFYVIEASSFQLERCINFHPAIAILLNITQDHLDRHGSFKEYANIKFKIFANQNPADYAIINNEDKTIMVNRATIKSKIYYFSNKRIVKGTYLKDNYIYFRNEKICSINNIKLLGTQFINSILPAVCAAKLINVKNGAIREVLQSFNGLEHRLEYVVQHNGVIYINNSMCTNPTAGIATLKSFEKPVILIAGGKEKNLEVADYIKEIKRKTKYVVLIGDNRYRLAKFLSSHRFMNFAIADSLVSAVITTKQIAIPGDIILFSPGFASFDSFVNFQERGKVFKEIIYGIK